MGQVGGGGGKEPCQDMQKERGERGEGGGRRRGNHLGMCSKREEWMGKRRRHPSTTNAVREVEGRGEGDRGAICGWASAFTPLRSWALWQQGSGQPRGRGSGHKGLHRGVGSDGRCMHNSGRGIHRCGCSMGCGSSGRPVASGSLASLGAGVQGTTWSMDGAATRGDDRSLLILALALAPTFQRYPHSCACKRHPMAGKHSTAAEAYKTSRAPEKHGETKA